MRDDAPPPLRPFSIQRMTAHGSESLIDAVTVEEPLEIRIGRETVAVTMRTPGHDVELAAGFLRAEGLVLRPEQIVRMEHCRDTSAGEEGNVLLVHTSEPVALDRARRLHLTTSSCGLCGKASIEAVLRGSPPVASDARFSPAVVAALPDRLLAGQATFGRTGGLHAAGIFDEKGDALVIREDVGRHNAVDKAVGRLFLDGRLPAVDTILCVSGRASFEIVQKAVAAGIPAVAAVSAPSSLAVDLARESRVLLAGFARDGAFNVYSGADRVAPLSGARSERG